MTLTQIKKFESQNNISINICCIEKKKELSILPIRLTKKKMDKYVNLLYVQNDVEHFAWIKNLFCLANSQLSKKEHRKYFCDRYVYVFNKIIKYFITLQKNKKIIFLLADAYTTSARMKS